MKKFSWKVNKKNNTSNARVGEIITPHGIIETPAFIFCGTKGVLKSATVEDAINNNTQIILSNTYHLMLQPGSKIIAQHGGLHNFMNWNGPMLTDSGGFQIFSLGHGSVSDEIKGRNSNNKRIKTLIKIMEEGALFKSYIDGSIHLLTPEKSIEVQRNLGADLILVFDECTPYNIDKKYTAESMERSHRWSIRSINCLKDNKQYESFAGSAGPQALYGIIQGGVHEDLREESIIFNIKNNNFFGFAIGGSLGSSKEEMYNVVKFTTNIITDERPLHLLGIGDPQDIWNLVECGIDTFDCVNPTRLARHGAALVKGHLGKINIKNSRYKTELNPINVGCKCTTCQKYSLSYLHHLLRSNELTAFQLVTSHNIFFMNDLMSYIRRAIINDNLETAKNEWYLN